MNRKNSALVITETGKNIGIGHQMRCQAIAQALDEIGIKTEWMIGGSGQINEDTYFETIAKHRVVIFDTYLIDPKIYSRLTKFSEKIYVHIDDNARQNYLSGIVVNGTIGAEKIFKTQYKGVTYLLGTKYIPIRKSFWDVLPKAYKKNIENVLITFGGDDIRRLTSRIVRWIVAENKEIKTINIVVGKYFKKIEYSRRWISDQKIKLWYNVDEYKMKNLMEAADIAVSAGGQTLYELARTGTPTIAIKVADNQNNNIVGWRNADYIEYAGMWDSKKLKINLLSGLNKLRDPDFRRVKGTMGRNRVDGQGARRIAEIIMRFQ